MKKFIYSALILGSAVALASCSADEPGAAKGDGNVTLTVQLPADAATRYGEGTSVTTLYYTVYAAGAKAEVDANTQETKLPTPLASGSVQWPAGKTQAQVELTLVPGDEYDVVFFADNSAAEASKAYTYDASTAALSIDYSKIASNSDDYDAFFTKYPNLSTETTEVIPLSRPFAQLNIGTNDWDLGVVKNHLANGGTYSSTLTFKAKGLASGVNFFSGDYTDATTAPAITIDKIELGDGYPVNDCKYLEMNYLLVVPAEDAPTLTEATYTVTAGTNTVNKLDLTNLPLRANYQTNVYGALLSTKATFKVEIQEGFATPAYSNVKWDGRATTPSYDEATATYLVSQPSDLAGIAEMVNKGTDFTGKVVKLNGDFDFSGNEWTPIGTSETAAFNGEFNGQNHNITGLSRSLFAFANGANIHNVNIAVENAPYTALVQKTYGNTTINNVTTKGSVNGSNKTLSLSAAGLVCRAMSGTLTVNGCTNNATVTDDSYCAGGIVGTSEGGSTVEINNCNNYGAVASNRSTGGKAGGIMGMPAGPSTISGCNNYATITTTTANDGSASGILAYSNQGFNIVDCTNSGDIVLNSSAPIGFCAAGGIFGASAISLHPASIAGCTNSGNITSTCTSFTADNISYVNSNIAGGILGTVTYNTLSVKDCTNSGKVSCISPEGSGQVQYASAICGLIGWQGTITFTGNNAAAGSVVTGNLTPFITAYYTIIGGTDQITFDISGNTNNTSYADTSEMKL